MAHVNFYMFPQNFCYNLSAPERLHEDISQRPRPPGHMRRRQGIYMYLHEWLIFRVDVGKYSNPIEHLEMGKH